MTTNSSGQTARSHPNAPVNRVDGKPSDDNASTPEIESVLKELVQLMCDSMTAGETLDHDRVGQLVKSLSTNGWERHRDNGPPLSTVLEQRVREQCPEPAMHRGAAVESLSAEIQTKYDSVSRYQSSAPDTSPAEDSSAGPQSPRAGIRG